jgi:hypothetical protein
MSEINPEFIEINVFKDECFLCFDTLDCNFIELKCCNKRSIIHSKCLFQIFLNYIPIQTDKIPCPLCRQEMSIKEYFTLDESINAFSNLNEETKKKFFSKFNNIISYNYIDSNHVLQTDEATSTITVRDTSILKKYLFTFISLVILILVVIGFKLIQW